MSIAADYYFNDERPIDEIKRYTGLTVEDISDAISKRQHMTEMAANKKPKARLVAEAEAPTIPTGATKTDFYDAIKELLVVAKDIQRMMKDFHADSFISKD
jgi:purine nucleoside permease